jgi:hypothetical protein
MLYLMASKKKHIRAAYTAHGFVKEVERGSTPCNPYAPALFKNILNIYSYL